MKKRAKFPLPTVVNPVSHRSVCIAVPDDMGHRQAFAGALYQLCKAYKWADDNAHTAVQAANVWYPIFDDVMQQLDLAHIECGEDMRTLVRQDGDCSIQWSYDNGSTWNTADLTGCADSEIISKILFRIVDDILQVSLDGGTTYNAIYNAKSIADTEIAAQILFRVVDNNLEVSLDGGAHYNTIYDAETIAKNTADSEIASQILFRVVDNNLEVSLDGGAHYNAIYDAETIAKNTADSEIASQILFQEVEDNLEVSLDGGVHYTTIYQPPLLQPGAGGPIAPGVCKVTTVTMLAEQRALLPLMVVPGSQIAVLGIDGAVSNGLLWFCPNGQTFFLGDCTGTPAPADPDAPVPEGWYLQPVLLIPNGNYISLEVGTIYTVPPTMPNGYYQIQANRASLAGLSGSYTLRLQVCAPISSNYLTLTYDSGSGPTYAYEGQEFVVNSTNHSEYGGYGQLVVHFSQCATIKWVSGNVVARGSSNDFYWHGGSCGSDTYYLEYGGVSTINSHIGEDHACDYMSSTAGLNNGPFVLKVISIP